MEEIIGDIGQPAPSPIVMALHFMAVMAMSYTLRFYYLKMAKTLASRIHVADTLPLLAGITFLVISIVKSSLALSLGLVGALSIVRFRTPIKEPEELAYIFLAMAIGLGGAAGEIGLTAMVFLLLLLFNSIKHLNGKKTGQEYYLHLEIDVPEGKTEGVLETFLGTLLELGHTANVEKIDAHRDSLALTVRLPVLQGDEIKPLIGKIKVAFPESNCSLFDSRPIW